MPYYTRTVDVIREIRAQSLSSGKSLIVTGTTTINAGGTLAVSGGSFASGGVNMQGGSLVAPAGVNLASIGNITGFGNVTGAVLGGGSSLIGASGGDLTLGDANRWDGFQTTGQLSVAASSRMILQSRGFAQLGSVTSVNGGTLVATKGMLLEEGKIVSGHGSVAGDFKNQGDVVGDGPGNRIVFEAVYTVSGIGTFENVTFNGTYSPGNSPTRTFLTNVAYGPQADLVMEIGGLNAGSQYDQLVLLGQSVEFDGMLDVRLIDGFLPALGDTFQVFQYQLDGGVLPTGTFLDMALPSLGSGLSWDTSELYSQGTLGVVPEPCTLVLMGLGGLVVLKRKGRAT